MIRDLWHGSRYCHARRKARVTHAFVLLGAANPYTEANYKPSFLTDDELKHLILRVSATRHSYYWQK